MPHRSRSRRRTARPPLPPRDGLDPARVRLPSSGPWSTLRDHLVDRLPVPAERVDAMLAEGRIVDRAGPVAPDAAFEPGATVWFHRDLPDEVRVPFAIDVLHRDDDIVVIDKPHFLATIPRGRHVRETALVRLRHELGLPDLGPAHRLDRVTAGVVLLVVRPELRGAYQTLFRDRRVAKTYEAVAPYDATLALPRTIRSRIVKERGVLQAREVPGEVNAETEVSVLAAREGLARYRLVPRTGRTHQLRLHLASLGLPILGDPFYPDLRDVALDDFRAPLQLLARALAFDDPITGVPRRFDSRRTLQAWDDPVGWAAGPASFDPW